MAQDPLVVAQLVTRIPRSLRHAMKVHCVITETTLIEFVTQAIAEKLARDAEPQPKSGRRVS